MLIIMSDSHRVSADRSRVCQVCWCGIYEVIEEGDVRSLYDLEFSVDKDSLYVGGLHGSYIVWRYVKDDFV